MAKKFNYALYWSEYFRPSPITRRAYSFLRAMNEGAFNSVVIHGCQTARTLKQIYPKASDEILAVALLHGFLESMEIKDIVAILAQILPNKVSDYLLVLHSLDFDFDDMFINYHPKQKHSDAIAEEQELYDDILAHSDIELFALKLAHRIEHLNSSRSLIARIDKEGKLLSSANLKRFKLLLSNTRRFHIDIAKMLGRPAKRTLYATVYKFTTISQDIHQPLKQKRMPRTMYMTS